MPADIHHILQQYWGYETFRPLQEEIIASVMNGHDTLGLLPTGGGKSITFQVPAIALGGLCLVVTPLIALMKDQKDHLVARGIRAAAVHTGMEHQEILETYERVIAQDYRFLYLSPERLTTRLFQEKLRYMDVRLLVVDEAHCISQWGYDFRPPYLQIAEVRRLLPPAVPCIALTATATPAVIDDIQARLRFRTGARVFRTSFERKNLAYSVVLTDNKTGRLLQLLQGVGCAIVYVRNRQKTRQIADLLTTNGIAADFYHAGLPPADKQQRQEAWMEGRTAVIVSTNAFGMGIDKPDVRLVVHLDLPASPEEYFQEAGRAGRDGQPARAVILAAEADRRQLRRHLQEEFPDREVVRSIYGQLASFFQIAIGAGYNCMFEFDLMRFCTAFHRSATQVHYALKLLDQAGYIDYEEEPDRHSRLMFTTTREGLYHLNQFDNDCQRIITALLRQYTGLFADYVFIREETIMRHTGLSRETLYEKLLLLTRHHVLHYIPARQLPGIFYLTPRLDNDEIRLHRSIYEERQEARSARIEAMIDYVYDDRSCRLVRLLGYFGEQLPHACGQCDVCRSREAARTGDEGQAIRTAIADKLALRPLPLHVLTQSLPFAPERIGEQLRQMIADGTIRLHDQQLSLVRE